MNKSSIDSHSNINEFINCKRIAIVGFSRNRHKFGNSAFSELKKRGYQVFAVHPTAKVINGEQCYPNLTSLQNKVDGVFISIKPEKVDLVLNEAASVGIKNIWLQKGAESKENLKTAERLGLNLVYNKCILMYAPPVESVHKWHRTISKLFGRL
jgi:predicted CoA-binding protein